MATYYVSAAGSDSNAGTEAAPWLTIAKVNTSSAASDTVYFRRGDTFNDATLACRANQIFGAYGTGAAPIIDGQNLRDCIAITAVASVTVQDLDLRTGTTFICLDFAGAGCNNCIIQDCVFNTAKFGIHTQATATGTGTIIRRCQFLSGLREDGVSTFGSWACEVAWCYFSGVGTGSTLGNEGDAVTTHDTATMDVHDCIMLDCMAAGTFANTTGINKFYRNFASMDMTVGSGPNSGIVQQSLGGRTDCWNCEIIFSGGAVAQPCFDSQTAGSILNVWNCVGIHLGTAVNTPVFLAATGTLVVKNCVGSIGNGARIFRANGAGLITADFNRYSHDTGTSFMYLAVNKTFAQWKIDTGQDANSTIGDPGLKIALGSEPLLAVDCRPLASSALIGAGTDLSGSGFTTDRLGRTRPYGAAWDIGSHEWAAGLPPYGASW